MLRDPSATTYAVRHAVGAPKITLALRPARLYPVLAGMARILSIDDDPFIRQLLKAQLTEHGHDVLEADTGDGGLAMARAELPDVILLDLGLPGMHGSVVLEELKASAETAGIPVIVVSAWGEGHALNMALQRG